jgi:hypothetical protein
MKWEGREIQEFVSDDFLAKVDVLNGKQWCM